MLTCHRLLSKALLCKEPEGRPNARDVLELPFIRQHMLAMQLSFTSRPTTSAQSEVCDEYTDASPSMTYQAIRRIHDEARLAKERKTSKPGTPRASA